MSVVLVTGAGSGVGRAVTLELLRAGHSVVLAGRREAKLAETVSLAEDGGRASVVPCDVTDEAAVDALFDRIRGEHSRLDVLFNNAGVMTGGDVGSLSYSDWRASVEVNLNGMFLCAQHAFNLMREQRPHGGRIINNGSISAHTPRPRSVAYTATKHAITGLTRSIALDGRAHDIACGQIDIGNAATEMTEAMSAGVPQADGSTAVEPRMAAADVATGVRYMAELPLSANVLFMTVMATGMPYVGRG